MPNVTNLFIRLFADDTFLAFQHKNIKKLNKIVNKELDEVANWLIDNRLSLNVLKSKFMLISRQKEIKRRKFRLNIKRKKLEQTASYKYLGVYFDEKLNWNSHVQQVCQKISKVSGVLSKLRYSLDLELLKNVYYALVYPYLLYGIMSWGCASESIMKNVRSVQNRVIKIMRFIPFGHYDLKPIYKEMDILQVDDIYTLEVGKFMYKFINGLLPENFHEYFKYVSNVHQHNTRTARNMCLYPIRSNTKFSKNTLKYKGVEVWNKIPLAIKNLPSIKLFCSQLKALL